MRRAVLKEAGFEVREPPAGSILRAKAGRSREILVQDPSSSGSRWLDKPSLERIGVQLVASSHDGGSMNTGCAA